ncbi:MAG TPA: glycoside hydrolase 100 family protein, partial [Patescibacteria group bacterium]|nr:glycoside hydrolase 100 family protein [Patescibacteria group bacterium]
MEAQQLINECYKRSIQYLKENATEYGMLAASPKSEEGKKKEYACLFSRDVGVSCLGMFASGNAELIDLGERSLHSLTNAQSPLGQFPFLFEPKKNRIQWWMPGSIDSTLWWCIALLKHRELTGRTDFFEKYKTNLEKAFTWLQYQDTNNDGLLEQGECSDWADEMPRHGAVLYTNALWYWLVRLRVEVEGRSDLAAMQKKVYEAANTMLWVHKRNDNTLNYVPDNDYTRNNCFAGNIIEWTNTRTVFLPYYLGCVSHRSFEMRCDVYGNILACLSGLADAEKANEITEHIVRSGINLPYPVKVLYPPIYPGEHDWKDYMAKGRQNYPWQYHNGGIWPYVGGFWVMWLSQQNPELAQKELYRLAQANQINNWEFNEYLHGQHGTP